MTVAVSNSELRELSTVRRRSRYNSLFDQSPFYTARTLPHVGITNANIILRDSTLTLSSILVTNVAPIEIFRPDELEPFFVFYLVCAIFNRIFKYEI